MKICKGDDFILVCKLGEKEINCYDGSYDRDTLKAWSKKGILKCPQCGEQYTYNHGKVRIPYFKHLNADCVMYGEPETEEHIQGKIDLFAWIQKQDGVSDVRLEGWLPETKQRPDIMFKYNGEQYVLELQCSPIASEYIKRHELYQAAGIHDIWICGTENYLGMNKRLNTLEMRCRIYYDVANKLFYQLEDLSEKEIDAINKMSYLRDRCDTAYKKRKYAKRAFHVMKDKTDYADNYTNYMRIKHESNNHRCVGSYYPSPTGRRSNKYPYPVKKYVFEKNYSHAACYKMCDMDLQKIKDRK